MRLRGLCWLEITAGDAICPPLFAGCGTLDLHMDCPAVLIANTARLARSTGMLPRGAKAMGVLAMGVLWQWSCAPEAMTARSAPATIAAPGAARASAACADDGYEPNQGPSSATVFAYSFIDNRGRAHGMREAVLCSGNQDWHLVPTELLGYSRYVVQIRVLARDAGWCGLPCGDLELLPGPENTIRVEMYDATGTWLMTGNVGERGTVGLDVQGDPVAHDLFLRITGPAAAQYPYRLHITVQDFEGEDECEC